LSSNTKTPYAFLYAQPSIDLLSQLHLPRYGLGSEAYLRPSINMSAEDENIIKDLNRGGKRLMGFCRINLFKRLESSEISFLYSLERHILRNYVMLYALENNLPVPLGTQQIEVSRFDTQLTDNDEDILQKPSFDIETEESTVTESPKKWSITTLQNRAADLYQSYRQTKSRFRWLAADYFSPLLTEHLQEDNSQLLSLLQSCEQWNSQYDIKLSMLLEVVTKRHPHEKILIFTQFADTALYLEHSLTERGIEQVAAVTGQTENPSEFITRFSPVSNSKTPTEKLRVLIATDVLSEGQNLQDAAIVVNYDLPWAIIRLIQRVGRVDRIGQKAEEILFYSFLPEEGVESLINLRERLRLRLHENAELIGTDEAFFEDDKQSSFLNHLYHEKADILEDEVDTEVDLISEAYAVWTKAIKENPALKNRIPQLSAQNPEGVIVYLTTPNGSDSLAWINSVGQIITDSPSMIFRRSACAPCPEESIKVFFNPFNCAPKSPKGDLKPQ
jgi:superfamily II DNA or RNA helicase